MFAGIFEEIAFRWLIFLGQIATYKLANYLFFYALWEFGVASWWHLNISAVWVNWVIGWPFLEWLHLTELSGMISGETMGWAVGAAILTSTGKFSDAHVNHGRIGRVIVWFIGLYMFQLVFAYGLPVAIAAHFLYDMIIFTIVGIDAMVEKKLGWV